VSTTPELPQPDPALRRLDRLVGTWTMKGNLVGSDEKNIKGETSFRWLPGGFFLEQRAHTDFIGQQIDALELIGYEPETDTFGQLYATFTGSWREDGTFSAGWRPNPGADKTVNVPYDIGGHRLA
jgi:hypothetical protein